MSRSAPWREDQGGSDLLERTRAFVQAVALPAEVEWAGDLTGENGDDIRRRLQDAAREAGVFQLASEVLGSEPALQDHRKCAAHAHWQRRHTTSRSTPHRREGSSAIEHRTRWEMQAIKYAAMASRFTVETLADQHARFREQHEHEPHDTEEALVRLIAHAPDLSDETLRKPRICS